jgi:hypothetical protein
VIWTIKELKGFRSGYRELEDNMETHEVYLEVFHLFFINYHGNVDVTLEFLLFARTRLIDFGCSLRNSPS